YFGGLQAASGIAGVQANSPFFFELFVTETLFVLRWFRCLNFTEFELLVFRLTLWVGPRSNGLVVKGLAFRVEYLETVVFWRVVARRYHDPSGLVSMARLVG